MFRWKVEMTAEAESQLVEDFKKKRVSVEDIKVIKRWVSEVESEGLERAQTNITWRDHELSGKWKNYRAISFSYSGRVIYKVEKEIIIVKVVRVTTDHNYT